MPEPGSTLPRRQLGRYLREYRTAMNLTLEEAARLMEWGKSTLQRLEKGQADKIRTLDVQELCRIYGIPPDVTTALHALAQQAAVKSWYHDFGDILPDSLNMYLGLESSARQLISYQEVVPGLLQTADYARALTRARFPDDPEADIARHVELRMQRQAVVTRKSHPAALDVVVHESVLRRIVGDPQVMATQLRRMADAGTQTNITLRVLPFTAGYPRGMLTGPFVILDFGDDLKNQAVTPPIVYIESMINANLYLEKPEDLARYHQMYEVIQHSALDATTSRNLLRQVAREYQA